ncbi:unnamed protein product [Malus baccata var. baccata]
MASSRKRTRLFILGIVIDTPKFSFYTSNVLFSAPAFMGFRFILRNNITVSVLHNCCDIVLQSDTAARRIQDGSVALPVKFLHFFLSRSLQFRCLSPLQPPPFSTSMLSWEAFIRSVSSMSGNGPSLVIR